MNAPPVFFQSLSPVITYANLTAETKIHLFAQKWFFGGNKAVRRECAVATS